MIGFGATVYGAAQNDAWNIGDGWMWFSKSTTDNQVHGNTITPADDDNIATKAYVDAAGGGSVVINGSTMPTMISSKSTYDMEQGSAMAYCSNLTENGYTDWRLPNRDELVYMVSGGAPMAITDNDYLWTSTMADASIYGSVRTSHWVVLKPAHGYWDSNAYSNYYYARCVR